MKIVKFRRYTVGTSNPHYIEKNKTDISVNAITKRLNLRDVKYKDKKLGIIFDYLII